MNSTLGWRGGQTTFFDAVRVRPHMYVGCQVVRATVQVGGRTTTPAWRWRPPARDPAGTPLLVHVQIEPVEVTLPRAGPGTQQKGNSRWKFGTLRAGRQKQQAWWSLVCFGVGIC